MYNLNVNVAPSSAGLLAVEGSCTTPKTPEILNSLIAMTSPFDAFPGSGATGRAAAPHRPGAGGGEGSGALSPRGDSCSSISSCSSLPGSHSGAGSPPLGSPSSSVGPGGITCSPPSVQHTCSQLIKEGLKLTIQSKRRQTGRDALDAHLDGPRAKMARTGDECGACGLQCWADGGPCCNLTAEDEERRRRRRERNKIAATKCRLKKRERTVNLVHESEILETQNHELKNQIQDLETQRRRLMEMLSMHSPTCIKNNSAAAHPANPSHPHGNNAAVTPTQLSPATPHTPIAPTTTFCSSSPDMNAQHHHPPSNYCDPYHSYGSVVACGFNGAYSAGGVDNGCMA